MPELSEEGDEAARAGAQRALRRPLLRVIGSARAVAFPMNVQMSGFPQLPLARDSKSAEYLEKSKQGELPLVSQSQEEKPERDADLAEMMQPRIK